MDLAPRQLILSLYGLYAREEGNWLSVASLIALMADLGTDSAAVRSSVSRLKRRGVLEAARREGQAGYALSADSLEVLREGDHRIWSRPRATAADGWLVLGPSDPPPDAACAVALPCPDGTGSAPKGTYCNIPSATIITRSFPSSPFTFSRTIRLRAAACCLYNSSLRLARAS